MPCHVGITVLCNRSVELETTNPVCSCSDQEEFCRSEVIVTNLFAMHTIVCNRDDSKKAFYLQEISRLRGYMSIALEN